ncbi:MAG TPA: hypothetical protein VM899_08300 [Rubellimicrobium sp.]|nr:hypothetical protein [Rubellimicrobium sp.]
MTPSFHQPVDAAGVPRFACLSTFMRLPAVTSPVGLDIALVGIPWDGGTTNPAGGVLSDFPIHPNLGKATNACPPVPSRPFRPGTAGAAPQTTSET